MASVVIAWTSEEKCSEEIIANQPESGCLEENTETAKPETPPQPSRYRRKQSLAGQPLDILAPPEEVDGDELEDVMVSTNMVVKIRGVMACGGEKGVMRSMPMDKKELLFQRRQPHQQQPQLPGEDAPYPWPPPLSADLDESNSERDIGSHNSLLFVLGGRAAAGSFAYVWKMKSEGRSKR